MTKFLIGIFGVLLNYLPALAAPGANLDAWPDPYSMTPETDVVNIKDYGAKGEGITDGFVVSLCHVS